MHVLVDLSGYREPLTGWLGIDAWAPESYPWWDSLADFVTTRTNSFTGIAYRDDPVIFQWLISGEPVPYGFTGNIHDPSRDVNVIEDLIFHVADRLRAGDTNHLISAGGLLHMNVPLDDSGQPYWKRIWSYPNIDCGAIHIYLDDYTNLPAGSWDHLGEYKGYCDGIGKPFILEEWGIDIYVNPMETAETYYRFGFDQAYANGIPITVNWDWAPFGGYSVFPGHADPLVDIVSENALRWGYSGPIYRYEDPPFRGKLVWGFEEGNEDFYSVGYPGNEGEVSVSEVRATEGSHSLQVPVRFDSTEWGFAGITRYCFPRLFWREEQRVACDVWAPPGATGFIVKFLIANEETGWKTYAQSGGALNNWLQPGQWNTVYADLASPYHMDWDPFPPQFNRVVVVTVELHHSYGTPAFAGEFYVDNFRVGSFEALGRASGWMILGGGTSGAGVNGVEGTE
jgi:hypothetical protein